MSTPPDQSYKQQMEAWLKRWASVAPVMERLRAESLKHVDTAAAIEAFDLAYKSARLHCESRKTSGLVEQQRWFQRARK